MRHSPRLRTAMRPLLFVALAVCALAALWSPSATARSDHRESAGRAAGALRVVFVDVGQGDAIILRSGGWSGLIDGGPAGSDARICKQLRKAGTKRLDCLVLSHLHADHIGGLLSVVQRYRPRTVLLAGSSDTATWRSLKGALKRVGARLVQVRRGRTLSFGKAKAKVLSPGSISGEPNEDSVVILLRAAGRRFLFTGDLTGANEATVGTICARGPPIFLLKVAHHGSRHSTSTSFLEQTRPKRAVICVGANSYGHPAPQTLKRLKASGARTYTTKKNGTITISVSGSGKTSWDFSRSKNAVGTAASTPTATPSQSGDPTVYITRTGECYHRSGCRYLASSKIAIKLSKAKARGYRPCSVCDPPAR